MCVGDKNSKIDCAKNQCVCRKNREEMIIVFVFVVQCLTQHAACTLLGCEGWFVSGLCWWF